MRYQTLDAWRGVACLLVILFHSTYYVSDAPPTSAFDPAYSFIVACERLWIGVPMFFVISGYCISATAQASVRKGDRTRDYFYRRVKRILPPYLICLAIMAIVIGAIEIMWPGLCADENHAIPPPWSLTASQWLGNLSLTEGWREHLAGDERRWFLAHAWTLGYEEQFYAVTGLILLVAPRRFFAAAAAITLAVVAATPWTCNTAGVFFNGYWTHFAAGIAVYYAINQGTITSRVMCMLLLAGGMVFASQDLSKLLLEGNRRQFGDVVAYSFAIALIVLHPLDKQMATSRSVAPLMLSGTMCYSLYLVHWPICKVISHSLFDSGLTSDAATVLITMPLCLSASLAAGWLFHVYVERRFLNQAAKRTNGELQPDRTEPDADRLVMAGLAGNG